MQSLGERFYQLWSEEYSKRNWYLNEPDWNTLTNQQRDWWEEFVDKVRKEVPLCHVSVDKSS